MGKTLAPFLVLVRAGACLGLLALAVSCTRPPPVDVLGGFAGPIGSIPEAWKEEPVVVLSDTAAIRLLPGKEGNLVQHRQATWYYVNRRNPNLLEEMAVMDFQSIETLPGIKAAAWYPEGGSWSPGALEIRRERHAEEVLHSSDRYVSSFRFPKYVQGMLIRVEITRTYTRPEFLKSELMRDSYPALAKTVILSLPKGWAVKHGLANAEGLPLDTARTETETGRILAVTARNLAKMEARSMPRNPETWFAALHFSLPARGDRSLSWAELGDAYLASIAPAFENTPELERLAAGLPRESPDSLIRRVYTVLRGRIRYHADLEILHSFVPRKAGAVLSKGYGDCKEMSTLMAQLLRIKGTGGVKVGVALVSTPGSLQVVEPYPSLGGFNHMVVYAETPDGGIRYYDPTVKHGDPADSYYDLIDRTSLVLRPGASALKAVPMAAGFQNRVETRSAIRRDPAGKGWNLAGTIRLEGHCAFSMIPVLNAAVGEEKTPLLKAFLKQLFAVDARDARIVAGTGRSIEVAYEASFNSNYLSMDKGGLLMAWPSLYGGDVRFSSVDVEGPRHVPKFEQSDSWEIPSGFDELEKTDLDHPVGRGRWTRKGAFVHRAYAAGAAVIPAEERDGMSEYTRLKNKFARATLWRR